MGNRVRSSDIKYPAVFIGDSRYDYEIAFKFNIDFIFISQYSEFIKWVSYFADKNVTIVENLNSIIRMMASDE